MPDDKKEKDKENSPPVASNRPANEAVGSSDFTQTTGSYPIRLPKYPQRSSGGFILEKAKDL
jgi:hypothetical protein